MKIVNYLSIAAAALALGTATAPMASAQAKACPPGLAKKDNGCTPPGLAKKQGSLPETARPDPVRIYGDGDYILHRYTVLEDPALYNLDPDLTYYRVGDNIYRVDDETGEVLAFLGALDSLLD